MAETHIVLLNEQAFINLLEAEMAFTEGAMVADTSLSELGFDSLQMFEIFLIVEELIDSALPESLLVESATVRDFYQIYVAATTQAGLANGAV